MKEVIYKIYEGIKRAFLYSRELIFQVLLFLGKHFLKLKLILSRTIGVGLKWVSHILQVHFFIPLNKRWKVLEVEMVGAMEKGIEAAKFTKPLDGAYESVDLRILPKYISFKAALLHNRLTQQYIILILLGLLVGHFIISRVETYSLYGQLRSKEYILAPGVQDFTPASPQSVPDSYVNSAVIDFLSLLGNVSASNIEEQYSTLSDSMSAQLKIKFEAEAQEWKSKVKSENISELLTVKEKEIRSSQDGYYQVLALTRRDTYINNEYIGHADEAIEMVLQLIPPKAGKRWYIQIISLSRQSADSYQSKKRMKG